MKESFPAQPTKVGNSIYVLIPSHLVKSHKLTEESKIRIVITDEEVLQ